MIFFLSQNLSIISLLITLIWSPSLFAGLIRGTKITTKTNTVCIETLKVSDPICGYSPTTHTFPDVCIKKITPVLVESIYVITIQHETVCQTITASPDQLFYEITSQKFVSASEIKPGYLFLAKDIKAFECISVEHKKITATVYDLTLEEPHLFFSSDAQILTHNAIPILLLGIPIAAPTFKFIASVGAIAGALYIEKLATSSLPIFSECIKRRELKAARRALLSPLSRAEEHLIPNDKSQPLPSPIIENTTPNGGQDPDPNNPKKKDDDSSREAVKKVLESTALEAKKRNATLYVKKGNENSLIEDFTEMNLTNIKDITHGKMGYLSDGRTVNFRSTSSAKKPTLEIYDPITEKSIKIRYDIIKG